MTSATAWRVLEELNGRRCERSWTLLTLEACPDRVEARSLCAKGAQCLLWVPSLHQGAHHTRGSEPPSDHRIWSVKPEDAGALADHPTVARINERPATKCNDSTNAECGSGAPSWRCDLIKRGNGRALADAESRFTFAREDPLHAVFCNTRACDDAAIKVEQRNVQLRCEPASEGTLPHAGEADERKVASSRPHRDLVVAAGACGACPARICLWVVCAAGDRCTARCCGTRAKCVKVRPDLFE